MLDSLETAIVGLTGVKTIKKKTRDTTIAVDFVFFFFYIVDILMLAKRQYWAVKPWGKLFKLGETELSFVTGHVPSLTRYHLAESA